ncbi:hypothetical protein BUALT_Bualt02G0121000 [Buddleja alternifolia]|uniref:Transposase MuDR plant domain-containing protein n=1 Tax=Buddleja alternifolia TaxID=168488 RepID=A0AAV6XZM1_9LAMI|nr:hypothetical protein BUALT_Bualt02G0121000 [Buddleja alternifolia]
MPKGLNTPQTVNDQGKGKVGIVNNKNKGLVINEQQNGKGVVVTDKGKGKLTEKDKAADKGKKNVGVNMDKGKGGHGGVENANGGENIDDESDFFDSDYNMDEDDGEGNGNNDNMFEENIDREVEWTGPSHMYQDVEENTDSVSSHSSSDEDDIFGSTGDEFDSDVGSDVENMERTFPIFNPKDKFDLPFNIGLIFSTKKEFKEAVHSHAIRTTRNLKITSNDHRRVYAKCMGDGCNWHLIALKVKNETSFQIRAYNPEHKCGRSYHCKNVNSRWLSKTFVDHFSIKGQKSWIHSVMALSDEAEEGRSSKGLVPVLEKVLPGFDKRFCIKHLHGNMKTAGFKGLAFKRALWGAAKASTMVDFYMEIAEIGELDPKLWDWLQDKPHSQWSTSHFNTFPKCDILLNNIWKAFNSNILKAREKPILTML